MCQISVFIVGFNLARRNVVPFAPFTIKRKATISSAVPVLLAVLPCDCSVGLIFVSERIKNESADYDI